MSYSDSQPPMHSESSYQSSSPPHMQLQSSYQSDSIVIPVLPQFPVDSNDQFDPHLQFDQPPYKRHRVSDDNNSQFRVIPSNNLPVNKGTTNIFFKTKMCAKFKAGTCRNGENCNFAHGEQDKRQPPPNWQELIGLGARSSEEDRPVGNWDDDQRIIHRMKLCKKFYNGEVCPYGDRCNFLHEEPSKFRDDGGRYRESSAISIGTTGQLVGQGSVCVNVAEVNRSVNTAVNINAKPVYWKTKLCTKMETTGHCPFGEKCHFAHGLAGILLLLKFFQLTVFLFFTCKFNVSVTVFA